MRAGVSRKRNSRIDRGGREQASAVRPDETQSDRARYPRDPLLKLDDALVWISSREALSDQPSAGVIDRVRVPPSAAGRRTGGTSPADAAALRSAVPRRDVT
jgi:hypothetical protein